MTAPESAPPPAVGERLGPRASAQLSRVLELLATDPASLSSIRDPVDGWMVHVADSLSGLEPVVEHAGPAPRIADVGAGAGFPGLVLAAALPAARVDLIESVGRKCEFMRRAIAAAELLNATVIHDRSEAWASAAGAGAYRVVTARAVGRLATLAELASPLLAEDGVLVAWKGRRNDGEERELGRAAERLAMSPERVLPAPAFAGAANRHLHLLRKVGPTPAALPRRPGLAKRRPLGGG